ncbi:MAG TPA: diguanylate cyclase [Planctomycetota bacterium]|nr:diguanylate cyclase [Planctomycetota bacterium]
MSVPAVGVRPEIQTVGVLIIEDDPADAAAAEKILASCKERPTFTPARVTTLAEARLHLEQGRTDLILLDLTLPDGSGVDALESLQLLAPDAPIVLFTNLDDEPTAKKALQKGAQDYLIKSPGDRSAFVRTLRHALERHRYRRMLEHVTGELREANSMLERLALLDPLTGLLNRRGLQQVLSREVHQVRRDGAELLVLLVDIDDFKRINDALGYAVGDVVLKEIARKLQVSLRATDEVARIGGDEFMILFPQTRRAEGMRVAEKVRLALSGSPLSLPSGPLRVTASLGLLAVSNATPSIDELLSQAHVILTRSKRSGKNRVSYGWSATPHGEDRHPLTTVLNGLRGGESLRAVMHPIFNLEDEREVGFEFLSRLLPGSFEMPDDFFRLSLEANILTLVDHRCFKNCVAAAAMLPAGIRRHVNLFPSTIIDIPVQHLVESLPRNGARKDFCIEISEQQIIGDPSYLVGIVDAFKREGVLVAIDDVGYGRSCLESVVLLEPDLVKIDKVCVNGIGRDESRARSLKRLIKVANSLGAEIVAEGIESRDDLDVLRDLGVKSGQGFLWGVPA